MITDQPDPNWEQSSYMSSSGVPPPLTTLLLSISSSTTQKIDVQKNTPKKKKTHRPFSLSLLFAPPPSPTNKRYHATKMPPSNQDRARDRKIEALEAAVACRCLQTSPIQALEEQDDARRARLALLTDEVLDLKTIYVLRMKRQDDKRSRGSSGTWPPCCFSRPAAAAPPRWRARGGGIGR